MSRDEEIRALARYYRIPRGEAERLFENLSEQEGQR